MPKILRNLEEYEKLLQEQTKKSNLEIMKETALRAEDNYCVEMFMNPCDVDTP